MTNRRIFTIGETVYDIIFRNEQPMAAKPGGAMLNTSISLGRLGLPVSFISEIGEDEVGEKIIKFLCENNVVTNNVYKFRDGKTSLALAFLDESENANYSFYKLYPAKRLVVDFPEVKENDIVLFGSFFAITGEVREQLMKFMRRAFQNKVIIIYDPNFRKSYLDELPKVKNLILENISLASIVRGSDEDFRLIFGVENADDAFRILKENGCSFLIYTSSDKNVEFISEDIKLAVPVPKIKPVSTIGAGDSFNAGIIFSLYSQQINLSELAQIDTKTWKDIIETAISFGTHVCQSLDNYISEEFVVQLL